MNKPTKEQIYSKAIEILLNIDTTTNITAYALEKAERDLAYEYNQSIDEIDGEK